MKFSRSALILLLLLVTGLSVQAKDEWTKVQSKNFLLVGNASEKDIRKVATRLEQFRQSLRQILKTANFQSPIPTNVVVFKSEGSYHDFKPKRADGKIDEFVAGYFQPGEDVNYITLSTHADDAATYQTIFHEYVHFIVNTNFGKSEVPPWFNEGLAEYYSTFAIEGDQKVSIGLPIGRHILLLRQSTLIPLKKLFSIRNTDLAEMTGGHSRTIFYAEAWALVHYLMQNGKGDGLTTFLNDLLKGVAPDRAFADAFNIGYEQMEVDLKRYVAQEKYWHNELTFKEKLAFDAEMTAGRMDEASTAAYLGDLLYHTNRFDDAEPWLAASLKLSPDASMSNTTLGMVKIRQGKLDDARPYLEKGIAGDPRNPIALYRYAYLLTREGRVEAGFVRDFDAATASKIRVALRTAIALNPAFTESYDLLAFVDVVTSQELDDAVRLLQTALKYRPGSQRYALRLAEVYMRKNELSASEAIAKKIAATTDDPDLSTRASRMLDYISQKRSYDEQLDAYNKTRAEADRIRRVETDRVPGDAELARRQSDANLRALNASLRKPSEGEQRVIGRVQRIDCGDRGVNFLIKSGGESFMLASKDFIGLKLESYNPATVKLSIGCEVNIAEHTAVISYRPSAKGRIRGELVAVEFVPADFRFMTEDEMRGGSVIIYPQP